MDSEEEEVGYMREATRGQAASESQEHAENLASANKNRGQGKLVVVVVVGGGQGEGEEEEEVYLHSTGD